MKKLLFNVVSVLILSICVLSCSKKDNDDVTPITKEEIVNEWTISESPVINVIVSGKDNIEHQKKVTDTLTYLFKQGDKYVFNENGSCTVARGSSIAPYPKTYEIEGGSLTFDGYIRFQTNVLADDKFVLTAGNDEIRQIVKKELQNKKYEESAIKLILNTVSGNVKLIFNGTAK